MQTAATKIIPTNNYFKNEPGLLSEWQIDYDNYIQYYSSLSFYQTLFAPCMIPHPMICVPMMAMYPCLWASYFMCNKPNIEDQANAQHVCLTDDGVNYTVEKHKTGCRCYCTDKGKTTSLLTFEKITDVAVEEPAGAELCGLVPHTLYTVVIHTAGAPVHILGLKEANNFKKEVLRVKKEKENKPMMQMMQMMQMQQAGQMMMQPQMQPPMMMSPEQQQQMMMQQQMMQQQMMQQQQGFQMMPQGQMAYAQPGQPPVVYAQAVQSDPMKR